MSRIAFISLTNRTGFFVSKYTVEICVQPNGTVRGYTVFQKTIGGSAVPGVELKCCFNVSTAIQNGTLEQIVEKLTNEANSIISKKMAKGYQPVGKNSFKPSEICALLKECQVSENPTIQIPSPPNGIIQSQPKGIPVEVIGMEMGVAKVAKVLPDLNYEVLGVIANAAGKLIRIGDCLMVQWSGEQLVLVKQ